ncbi:glutactin-like [Vanessa cardui]|uniref:glutactin-like n=1 Tax=Vanessa cardui TaxID=171605 RepID=UPI001F143144|nr:glutactin-like [Vanessa cardui]
MQSTIFFMLAIVAFTAAKQLNPGPQAISESSSTSKANDKRFATQEITLFLTPSQIKSLNEARNSANNEAEAQSQDNQQYILQGYGQQPEQTPWPKYTRVAPVEQPQEESQGFISQSPFLYKSRPIENQDGGFDPFNFYREQKLREQQAQIIEQEQEQERKEAQLFRPYNPVSDQAQEEALLHDELQQHWNRLLEHNRGQLKALSEANEKQNAEDLKANKESSQEEEEEARSEIEKQIQSALRNNKPYNFRQENSRAEEQGNNQRSPILIQKEVRVTKHLPVRVVEKVKVSVPTPVLVPVPEPYEVKVPHPYPVPYQIIKHIPVPVIRKH